MFVHRLVILSSTRLVSHERDPCSQMQTIRPQRTWLGDARRL